MTQPYLVTAQKDGFRLDGKPFRILSGAVHYFRVHPDCWEDRLRKLRACGLNTVETYIPWNLHEPREGQFTFDGFADIERFIRTADGLGLHVILRPGPYICAEWDLGGFPAWLTRESGMRLRCAWPPYMEKVRAWFGALLPRLVPHLCTRGGPVIAVQVENEYGSYGNDKAYLRFIEGLLLDAGVDCLLFTSDGPSRTMLTGGTLPHLLKTVNFGSRPTEAFEALRRFDPDSPPMCCEFWCGWFDHWGEAHHTRDAEDVAAVLDEMLSQGASVNFYMFHGGTNFGLTSGANLDAAGKYQPTTTSYDYHAPLDEAGDITPAYEACRRVLAKHLAPVEAQTFMPSSKRAYGPVRMTQRAPLDAYLAQLPAPVRAASPLSMVELGGRQGYVLYRAEIEGPIDGEMLHIPSLRDRATVLLDGARVGTMHRDDAEATLTITVPQGHTTQLDILVENMGHVNYGTQMELPKGISGYVRLGHQCHFGWTMHLLEMDALPRAWQTSDSAAQAPCFLRGVFDADEVADTYLDMCHFQKGIAYVNGFCLGRYWSAGPFSTLYVPAQVLRKGENELAVFETDGFDESLVEAVDTHRLIAKD